MLFSSIASLLEPVFCTSVVNKLEPEVLVVILTLSIFITTSHYQAPEIDFGVRRIKDA